MRRVVLEVRGRALPRHVQRCGSARPSGEPLPVHPSARVAGVERSRDCLRDAAVPIAALARSPKPGKAGRYTVVFDPLIFGSITDQTGGRLGAWTVMAGLSPFGKKIGKKVASPQLTLYDDGSGESIARKRFDAEGVPTRRNVLVNKGVLRPICTTPRR